MELVVKDLGARGTPRSPEPAAWILLGRATELSRQIGSVIRSRGEELVEGCVPHALGIQVRVTEMNEALLRCDDAS